MRSVKKYANMVVLGLLVVQIFVGLAVYRLPRVRPEAYQKFKFKFPPFWHNFFSLGMVLLPTAMLLLLAIQNWHMVVIELVCLAIGLSVSTLETRRTPRTA